VVLAEADVAARPIALLAVALELLRLALAELLEPVRGGGLAALQRRAHSALPLKVAANSVMSRRASASAFRRCSGVGVLIGPLNLSE
jgi:hypothetical protein